MSKAEERAETAYPTWRNDLDNKFNSSSAYCGFIKGYNQAEKDLHKSIYKAGFLDGFEDAVEGQYEKGYAQAEKDLELTWEDISIIRQIIFDYNRQIRNEMSIPNDKEYCEEVLKRFKERKKGEKV